MEGLATKSVRGAPALLPLQFRTGRQPSAHQHHHNCPSIPRSPLIPKEMKMRASLRSHNTNNNINAGQGQGQQTIKPVAPIQTAYSPSPHEANKKDTLNLKEQLKNMCRTSLMVITLSVLVLNFQGTFLCRPAAAAWWWPFKSQQQEEEDDDEEEEEDEDEDKEVEIKIDVDSEFWKDPEWPLEYKEEVLLDLVEEFDAKDVNILVALLFARIKHGDTENAIRIVNRIILLKPYEKEWRLVKAQILESMGSLEEARSCFEYYLTLEEFNARALQGLAMVMHKCGEDDAMIEMLEERLQKALQTERKDDAYNMKLLLANAYILQDKLEEALKQYQCMIDENPKDFRPYLCQGILYSVLDKKDEAEKRFETYRKLAPKSFHKQELLDKIMLKAKTEGHKRYEERKKEEELVAKGKSPAKRMKQPKIGGAMQDVSVNNGTVGGDVNDLTESEGNTGGDIEDLREFESTIGEDIEDLPESETNIGGDVQDLPESESSASEDIEDLPESKSSTGGDMQDLQESERKH